MDFPPLIRAYDAIEAQVRLIAPLHTPNQLGALVSFSFNLFVGRTDIILMHNAGQYQQAAHLIANHKFMPTRRIAEAILYLS